MAQLAQRLRATELSAASDMTEAQSESVPSQLA